MTTEAMAGKYRMRASQGFSQELERLLDRRRYARPLEGGGDWPQVVLHGTMRQNAFSISVWGLMPMGPPEPSHREGERLVCVPRRDRTDVHMVEHVASHGDVAGVRNGTDTLVAVDLRKYITRYQGVVYRSSQGVYLTAGVGRYRPNHPTLSTWQEIAPDGLMPQGFTGIPPDCILRITDRRKGYAVVPRETTAYLDTQQRPDNSVMIAEFQMDASAAEQMVREVNFERRDEVQARDGRAPLVEKTKIKQADPESPGQVSYFVSLESDSDRDVTERQGRGPASTTAGASSSSAAPAKTGDGAAAASSGAAPESVCCGRTMTSRITVQELDAAGRDQEQAQEDLEEGEVSPAEDDEAPRAGDSYEESQQTAKTYGPEGPASADEKLAYAAHRAGFQGIPKVGDWWKTRERRTEFKGSCFPKTRAWDQPPPFGRKCFTLPDGSLFGPALKVQHGYLQGRHTISMLAEIPYSQGKIGVRC